MALPLICLMAGFLLFAVILQDAFEVMLLPRRVRRRLRLTRLFYGVTWAFWRGIGARRGAGPHREKFLGIYGPLSLTLLFCGWCLGLFTAFALVLFGADCLTAGAPKRPFAAYLYASAGNFFTIGTPLSGDLGPAARSLSVAEAGVGLGFIAVVIGYLPVLYQLFSRRESHVIQLDARAGSPPSAYTMLARHAEAGGLAKLDDILRAWEIWGADMLESHLSYPMLVYYRSQHDDQSWLGALAAVMDTCVLVLLGVEEMGQIQARMTFAMARQVVLELGRALEVSPAAMAEPRLSHEEFGVLQRQIIAAGIQWKLDEGNEDILAAVRATYEPLLMALADHLLIPIPRWLPEDDNPDHWERGPRGIIARRLIDRLSDTTPAGRGRFQRRTRRSASLAAKVRDRLRKAPPTDDPPRP